MKKGGKEMRFFAGYFWGMICFLGASFSMPKTSYAEEVPHYSVGWFGEKPVESHVWGGGFQVYPWQIQKTPQGDFSGVGAGVLVKAGLYDNCHTAQGTACFLFKAGWLFGGRKFFDGASTLDIVAWPLDTTVLFDVGSHKKTIGFYNELIPTLLNLYFTDRPGLDPGVPVSFRDQIGFVVNFDAFGGNKNGFSSKGLYLKAGLDFQTNGTIHSIGPVIALEWFP